MANRSNQPLNRPLILTETAPALRLDSSKLIEPGQSVSMYAQPSRAFIAKKWYLEVGGRAFIIERMYAGASRIIIRDTVANALHEKELNWTTLLPSEKVALTVRNVSTTPLSFLSRIEGIQPCEALFG
jgi:hypothetical protein